MITNFILQIAILAIGSVVGYGILILAYKQENNDLKTIGKFLGAILILAGILMPVNSSLFPSYDSRPPQTIVIQQQPTPMPMPMMDYGMPGGPNMEEGARVYNKHKKHKIAPVKKDVEDKD